MSATTETPRRRRFAISLRALMLLVLAVGGLIGWRANRAQTQRKAVEVIRAAKGAVTYDFQVFPRNTPRATISAAKPPGPAWLRRPIGDEYFQEVASVTLDGPVTAETMAAIGSLDRLESIYFKNAPTIGGGLATLRGLSRLKRVNITSPAVTDADLAILGRSRNLELVWLTGADITDSGLSHLVGLSKLAALDLNDSPKLTDAVAENLVPTLPSLKSLELIGSAITDATLASLGRRPGLNSLDVSRTKVTDAGIAHLSSQIDLELLRLNDTAVTDEGIKNLKGLTRLRALHLDRTAITDAGMVHLGAMPELFQLNLRGTRITGEGFAHLEKLPKLGFLRLDQSATIDAGMPHLAKLPSLRQLFLGQTQVSDEGLVQLQGAPQLSNVSTGSSRVTDAGYAAFRKAMPRVKMGSNRPIRVPPPASSKPG